METVDASIQTTCCSGGTCSCDERLVAVSGCEEDGYPAVTVLIPVTVLRELAKAVPYCSEIVEQAKRSIGGKGIQPTMIELELGVDSEHEPDGSILAMDRVSEIPPGIDDEELDLMLCLTSVPPYSYSVLDAEQVHGLPLEWKRASVSVMIDGVDRSVVAASVIVDVVRDNGNSDLEVYALDTDLLLRLMETFAMRTD
jgi:hypothetical protein